MIRRLIHAALTTALALAPLTATAQKISDLPAAVTLTGPEMLAGAQGSGCATHVAPCSSVRVSATQLSSYANANLDPQLLALAGLSPSADQCVYWTGSTAASLYGCTSFMRGLDASANASAARGTLGVTATGADTAYAFRANNLSDLASPSTARTNLGVAIGSNVQAFSSVLATYAGISPSANVQSLLGAADYAAIRALTATPWVVAKSAVAVPLTGSTSETTLATITIPANAIGPNGQVEIYLFGSAGANNANAKTFRVKFGGTTYATTLVTSALVVRAYSVIANRNAASSQVGFPTANDAITGTVAPITSAVDTTASVAIDITGQLGTGTDTITLESYFIRVTFGG